MKFHNPPSQPTAPHITLGSWGMVGTLGVVWGATFLVMELALRGFSPLWLAAGRMGLATVLTGLIWGLFSRKLWLGPQSAWGMLLIVSLFSVALPFMLLSWGQQYVNSGFAGVSMAAVALMVLPMAHFLIPHERLSWRRSTGFLIGFVGVVILIGGNALQGAQGETLALKPLAEEPLARLACLGAATCYALSSIMMRLLPPIDPIGLSATNLAIGSLLVTPLAFLVHGAPASPPADALFYLILLALVPTATANLLRVLVIRTAGPVFMGLTNYQVPVWSVIFGAVFLDEPVGPSLLIALFLILSGVAISEKDALIAVFRRVKRLKPAP